MTIPLVSIIIPCFNHSKYLSKTLDSCLKQTYSNLEIIIVNDGSTDESLDIIKDYAKTHENIKYFSTKNQGQCAARNLGLESAKGEFIKFLDGDDLLLPFSIERQVKSLQDCSTDVTICASTGFWDLEEEELYQQLNHNLTHSLMDTAKINSFFDLLTKHRFTFNEVLIRKSLILDVGGFNSRLRAAEELNLCLKLMTKLPNLQGAYDDNLRLLKRLNYGSLAHTMREQKDRNWLLESLYYSAQYYIDQDLGDNQQLKKYIFDRLYITSMYAYRNGFTTLAKDAIKLWNQAKLPYPHIEPFYHKFLHHIIGFVKAEKLLLLMRTVRDLLKNKNYI